MRLPTLVLTFLALSLSSVARAEAPIAWQWDEVAPYLFPDVDLVAVHGGSSYRLSMTTKAGHDQLRLTNGSWTISLPRDPNAPAVAIAADDARIYLATYHPISSGCALAAYSASDGKQLWTVQLVAAGPISHSKYFNRVQLRVIDAKAVVFGNEAAKRYIEVRDAATGAAVSNTPLPAQMYPYPIAEALYRELAAVLAHDGTCEVTGNDFLARLGFMNAADHATRATTFAKAVAALDGMPLAHGAYTLHVELVDTKTDFRIKARRLPARP
jgi:hypothetical protein